MLMKDQAFLSKQEWRYIIVDEAHRLKSKDSKTTRSLKQLNVRKGGLLLLTGTPVQNNTKEIFSLLNLLDPQKFCLEEDFLLKYGDLKNAEQVRDLQENILKPRLLRRLKEEVEKSIPLKEETIIWVELTKEQRSYYRAILESRISDLLKGSQTSNIPNLRNVAMELRKLCNHPFLCNGLREDLNLKLKLNDGNFLNDFKDSSKALCLSSGKMMLLEKLLPMLKNAGHRVLLFSQFAIMLDLLEEYLISKDYTYERIDGSVRGSDRQAAIDRYSAKDSDTFLFLLSTRAGGLGITLTAADTCIIYDSDWNPQNDLQAMARCHRIGQKKDVRIYRLITRNTYEQHLFECSSRKYGLDEAILGSMQGINPDNNEQNKNIENLLKRGAYSMLKEDGEAEAAAFHAQNIEQILESRTEKRLIGRRGNNTFSVATFISNPEVDSVFDEKPDSDGCPSQFWQDLLPEACFTDLNVDKKIQTSCGPRKRLKINYRERYGASDLESSDEECENSKGRYHSTRRKDIQDPRTTDGVKQWSEKELKRLESCLIQLGANRTEQIMVEAGLEHRGIEEVQQLCDVLTQLCHYFQVKNAMVHNDSHPESPDANAEVQSKIPKYENDPLSQYGGNSCPHQTGGWNSCTLKNFSPSPNGVITSNGMNTKQGEDLRTSKKGAETPALGASSANMHPKKGTLEMPMVPPYAQKAVCSQTFMNRLQKKATRYLQTIHERETLAKALCDGKIVPPCVRRTKKLPNWWDAAEDADLLMGAHRHGHRNFHKIREDKSLCFSSRFDLVKNNILNAGDPHTENCVRLSAVTDGIENPTETGQDKGNAWPQDFVLASRLKKLIQALQTHTGRDKRLQKEAAKEAVLTRCHELRVINRSQASGTHPQEGLVILQRCLSEAEGATHSKQSRVELSNFNSIALSSSRELMTRSEKQTLSTVGPVPLLATGSKYNQCSGENGYMEVPNTSSEGSEDENFHFKESATQHLFRRQRMAPAGNHSITTTITENGTFLLDLQAKNTVKACLPSIQQTPRRHPIWAPGKENGPVPSSRPPKQAGLSIQQKTGERRWPLVSSKLQPLSTASNSSSVNLQASIPIQKHKDVPKRKAYSDAPVSSKKLKDFGKQQTLLGFLAPKSAGAK